MTNKRDIGYVSTRGDPVETSFKPSVKACTDAGCTELTVEEYGGVRRKVCGVNNRIPGNLGKCPKEVLNAGNELEAIEERLTVAENKLTEAMEEISWLREVLNDHKQGVVNQ